VGNYRNATAGAVGVFYRPNEDTMVSVGGTFGNGENMVNAGISLKLGQGNHVSTSRVAMAKEIKNLREAVANQNKAMERQEKMIADQQAQIAQLMGVVNQLTGGQMALRSEPFPDVPENHWAYEYVEKLRAAGMIEGYPDGEYKGDRTMTRYEWAAILARAMANGAGSDPALASDGTLEKLLGEFDAEMKYIRVDTLTEQKNGKPDIQRVRAVRPDPDKV